MNWFLFSLRSYWAQVHHSLSFPGVLELPDSCSSSCLVFMMIMPTPGSHFVYHSDHLPTSAITFSLSTASERSNSRPKMRTDIYFLFAGDSAHLEVNGVQSVAAAAFGGHLEPLCAFTCRASLEGHTQSPFRSPSSPPQATSCLVLGSLVRRLSCCGQM